MTSALDRLKQHSSIVADTGDIEAIRKHQPEDATTNPSLLLKAADMPAYSALIKKAWDHATQVHNDEKKQVELACDYFAVLIGKEIADIVQVIFQLRLMPVYHLIRKQLLTKQKHSWNSMLKKV